jgi:hypothetical protein
METIRLACHNRKIDELLAHLRGKIFHLTTFSAFTAIRKTGKILHNKDGRFGLNTTLDFRFGRLMGNVCLFDLRDHSAEVSQRILDDYYFLDPTWFQEVKNGWIIYQVAYLVLDPASYEKIIPNHKVHEHGGETGKYLHFIPHGEVWIDDHVPLDWIETVILANLKRPRRGP